MIGRHLLIGVALALLTGLSFWWFPGHTILQSDTQVYIPILQHLRDPQVLDRDAMAAQAHVAFTIYDEMALFLATVTGASFEVVLLTQQALFRGTGILGLFLIGRGAGLSPVFSFTLAALVSLGATVNGPQVLTVEYEPVPRGFAFGLVLLTLGLLSNDRWRAACLVCAIAFAYHPPTSLPVFLMLLVLCARERRWREAWFLSVGPLLVGLSVFFDSTGGGGTGVRETVPPALEAIQRMRASYNWVDTWLGRYWLHYGIVAAASMAGAWRIRKAVLPAIRPFLFVLPILGCLSVGLSWLLLGYGKWMVAAQYQPGRYLVYVPFFAALCCGIAGLRAAAAGRIAEAALFLFVPFAVPLEPDVLQLNGSRLALASILAFAAAFAKREPFAAAPAILAFALYPTAGQVINFPLLHTRELHELTQWARSQTPADSVFQFADARKGLEPGIFRVRAERAIYADWKAGGQVNFLPQYAYLWADRWRKVERVQPLSVYRELGIHYVVYGTGRVPRNAIPVYSNRRWSVLQAAAN
ncbi:MAG: hypothetical protein H7039_17205 [Bryobacteraceae bacterium]|nr:hypothetical protein [Bryobacteraceae bacterium]